VPELFPAMPVAVLAVDSVCHESPDQDFRFGISAWHLPRGEVPGAYTQVIEVCLSAPDVF